METRGARESLTEGRWPRTVEEAELVQRELAERVRVPSGTVPAPQLVAGLDVSYAKESERLAAAAVLVDTTTGAVVEETVVKGFATFGYYPGLLAFREVPILLQTLRHLKTAPDLLLCDGQGLAHPRRCGLACHLGVLTGLAAIGCAKTHFVGEHAEPGLDRGHRVPLVDSAKRWARYCVLRTASSRSTSHLGTPSDSRRPATSCSHCARSTGCPTPSAAPTTFPGECCEDDTKWRWPG